jgi:hypothetical protein
MANPCRENPMEGEGIVLIDELDLHMHLRGRGKYCLCFGNFFRIFSS